MRSCEPEIGHNLFSQAIENTGAYALVTMEEPLALVRDALPRAPSAVVLNGDMSLERLDALAASRPDGITHVAGLGGGSACDTAKFLSWKWNLPLILSPSVISVDAWLCRSIAVRDAGRVRYIGDVTPERIVVDLDIVTRAPAALNRAGVADVVSIATALGDWLIARDEFGEPFDQTVFDEAAHIVENLMAAAADIAAAAEDGIRALVRGLVDEVALCERHGSARPEEGSEHFLAYCLENITRAHYIHGNLIALNVLTVLKLQREHAVFDVARMNEFFDTIKLEYAPRRQGIAPEEYRRALETAPQYVRREDLFKGLWWRERIFDGAGPCSINGIMDWIYSFE